MEQVERVGTTCPYPDFREIYLCFPHFKLILVLNLLQTAFIWLSYAPYISNFYRTFIMKAVDLIKGPFYI